MYRFLEKLMHKRECWISVNNRLPEGGWCLVACNQYGRSIIRKAAYDRDAGWLEVRGDVQNITEYVTHWMPLPNPPEEYMHGHEVLK